MAAGTPVNKPGIVSYGTYLPMFSVSALEIAAAHGLDTPPDLGVRAKTIPDVDEDTITLATAALVEALAPLGKKRDQIGALFVGSESHPYAVKPSGTVVANALGLPENMSMADLQFACKAGTQVLQIAGQYVASGQCELALAVGADTAQSRVGDVLEYTAAAGAAAYAVGQKKVIAEILATTSYQTDTPDFWRRPGEDHPQHAGRFTGEPAYFAHIAAATKLLLQKLKAKISDFDHVVFHTPNGRFPVAVAKSLGCKPEQQRWSLPVKEIGNTYAAASLLALASVLDHAEPGEKILLTSYGSGAGADSFAFLVTDEIVTFRTKTKKRLSLEQKITRLQPLSYNEVQRKNHARGESI